MATIKVNYLLSGDVLTKDVIVNDVVVFEEGTVLVKKCIEILKILKVETVEIENRSREIMQSLGDIRRNIDSRFSYVADDPFMMSLKNLVIDVVTNMKGMK